MKRPGQIARTSRIERHTEIRRRNRKRAAKTFARAYGGGERAEWVTQQPCVVHGTFSRCERENVHIRGGGGSRKADADQTVALCRALHDILHDIGVAPFEARFHIDLEGAAARTERRWQAERARRGEDAE